MDKSYAPIRIGSVERTGYYFGRECDEHLVMMLKGEYEGIVYETSLPVMLQEGCAWEFYEGGSKNSRAVTEKDQLETLKQVESYFPDFGEIKLDGASIRSFIKWLGSGEVTVNAKIDENEYRDKNGEVHHRFKCCKPGRTFDDSWLDSLGKATAAVAKKAAAPMPKAKSAPTPAPKKEKNWTKDDAWESYQNGFKDDPKGEKFWERVAEVIGKDASDWEEFNGADWKKAVDNFSMRF